MPPLIHTVQPCAAHSQTAHCSPKHAGGTLCERAWGGHTQPLTPT